MKPSLRTEVPQLALIALMFAAAAGSWPAVEPPIPVHWNAAGEVDRSAGRFEGLLLLPLTALVNYVLLLVVPRLDPGSAHGADVGRPWLAIRVASLVLLAVLHAAILLTAHGVAVDVLLVTATGTGLFLVVVGNALGKIRPNWFAGVRTPWTLSSKTAWLRTQRLAGFVLIAGGVVLAAAGLLRSAPGYAVALAVVLLGLLGATVYSYFVWRADPHKVPPAGSAPVRDEDSGD
jgi:uncharacterized membrane protein